MRWLEFIINFDVMINYQERKANKVADALSCYQLSVEIEISLL